MLPIPSSAALKGLSQQFGAADEQDPLGLWLKQRARETNWDTDLARNPQYMSGPLHDPNWDAFNQTLMEQGVSKIGAGPSPTGSRQLTGQTYQPDYFTGGPTFMGRPTRGTTQAQILEGLQNPYSGKWTR